MVTPGFDQLSVEIKEKAYKLGFDLCGIAKARVLNERTPVFRQWIAAGMHDEMDFLVRNTEKRLDPSSLVPGAKSVIVTGLNYYSKNLQRKEGVPVISRYSYGKDYHDVIKPKLTELLDYIKTREPSVEGRIFCDSAPVHEKAWAVEAGLGWQGRHSVVINPEIGSFFFIGIVIVDTELDYDYPFRKDLCGNCTVCIDECPTGAINNNRTIDARKCIANLTIENKASVPSEYLPKLGKRIYGCDRCQEVCPWNKNTGESVIREFRLPDEIAEMNLSDWMELTEEKFTQFFAGSAIYRKRYEQFKENIINILK